MQLSLAVLVLAGLACLAHAHSDVLTHSKPVDCKDGSTEPCTTTLTKVNESSCYHHYVALNNGLGPAQFAVAMLHSVVPDFHRPSDLLSNLNVKVKSTCDITLHIPALNANKPVCKASAGVAISWPECQFRGWEKEIGHAHDDGYLAYRTGGALPWRHVAVVVCTADACPACSHPNPSGDDDLTDPIPETPAYGKNAGETSKDRARHAQHFENKHHGIKIELSITPTTTPLVAVMTPLALLGWIIIIGSLVSTLWRQLHKRQKEWDEKRTEAAIASAKEAQDKANKKHDGDEHEQHKHQQPEAVVPPKSSTGVTHRVTPARTISAASAASSTSSRAPSRTPSKAPEPEPAHHDNKAEANNNTTSHTPTKQQHHDEDAHKGVGSATKRRKDDDDDASDASDDDGAKDMSDEDDTVKPTGKKGRR